MPQYLVRLAQIHESFRKAELHALANLAGVELEIVKYDDDVGSFALFFFFLFSLAFRCQNFILQTTPHLYLTYIMNHDLFYNSLSDIPSLHTASSTSHPTPQQKQSPPAPC